MNRSAIIRVSVLASFSLVLIAAGLLPAVGTTVPVVQPLSGTSPDNSCRRPMLAPNGRVVAFASEATNLAASDTDGLRDIFVVQLRTRSTVCASMSSGGVKADGDSDEPVLDRAGRSVAFVSEATNLVHGDTNGLQDVFVRTLKHGTTQRVSVASDGTEADGISDFPWISADGRFVAFTSVATNLVPDDTNGVSDVFVRDLETGRTTRGSVAADGSQLDGPSDTARLSANGRWLAFASGATNAVPNDVNGAYDIFVRDLKTGAVELVSVASDGTAADGPSLEAAISANGRRVAFSSQASNLSPGDAFAGADVFVRDRKKHTTTLVSAGLQGAAADGQSTQPNLSGSGRWVAFTSDASDLVAGDANGATDVFRRKLKTGTTELLSVSSSGVQANGNSVQPRLSRNGRLVVFGTRATNLFDQATDGVWSIALRRP